MTHWQPVNVAKECSHCEKAVGPMLHAYISGWENISSYLWMIFKLLNFFPSHRVTHSFIYLHKLTYYISSICCMSCVFPWQICHGRPDFQTLSRKKFHVFLLLSQNTLFLSIITQNAVFSNILFWLVKNRQAGQQQHTNVVLEHCRCHVLLPSLSLTLLLLTLVF